LAACDVSSCAAGRAGITSAANNVIAVMHVNVLDFTIASSVRIVRE
jgi:hypothetical protein